MSLRRWFQEKWVDTKTGKPCGRQKGEKRKGYPACRPSRRVSSKTPKTTGEMSKGEKAKFNRTKTSKYKLNHKDARSNFRPFIHASTGTHDTQAWNGTFKIQ